MEVYEMATDLSYHDDMRRSFVKQADAFMIIFALNSRPTFDSIPTYIAFIQQYGPRHVVPLLIVASKSDLTGEYARQVTSIEMDALRSSHECTTIEVSSKDNINVEEAFFSAVRLGRDAKRAREAPRRKGGCYIQ